MNRPTANQRRLLMIGVDAISLPFIREHLDRLPVFASFLDTGLCRSLESPAAHLSASVWPTFASGLTPGETGQYYPFQWDASHQRFQKILDRSWSRSLNFEPFWHPLARSGVETVAFDMAHVLHDEEAPCLQITNWSYQSSSKASASEPSTLRQLQRRFGRRPIGAEVPVPKTLRQSEEIRDSLVQAVRRKADATLFLMERPWQLFLIGFYEAHRAGHNLWPVDGAFASDVAPDAMLSVYEETDRQLGRILAKAEQDAPGTPVVLFSLHGMEANRAQDHFLAEILARLNRLYLGEPPVSGSQPRTMNMMAYLRQALPPSLQYRAAELLGETVQDWVVNRTLTSGRKWARTPSFALASGGEGLVRLNIKGRERQGFFEAGSSSAQSYSDWLRSRLEEIRVAGTNEALIAECRPVGEVYGGSRQDFLPDLIIRWQPTEPVECITSPDLGVIRTRLATGRGGNHNGLAFMMARGDQSFLESASKTSHVAELRGVAERYFTTS